MSTRYGHTSRPCILSPDDLAPVHRFVDALALPALIEGACRWWREQDREARVTWDHACADQTRGAILYLTLGQSTIHSVVWPDTDPADLRVRLHNHFNRLSGDERRRKGGRP